MSDKFSFFEFFAGGGMARSGLGEQWQCVFANDMDLIKASTYIKNWGAVILTVATFEKLK
ncbi:hypothetical protein ACE0DR_28155 [Azotobacter sp. CWF10]